MALRMVELFLPNVAEKRVDEVFGAEVYHIVWKDMISDNQMLLRILIPSEVTQDLMDIVEREFSMIEGMQVVILPVEAANPKIPEAKEEITLQKEFPFLHIPELQSAKVARQELVEDIEDSIKFSWIYIIMVILSTVVAAIGILRDSEAFIIGAMVIAPLLGPNVALSFATTVGDIDLARRATKANLVGLLTALAMATFLGFVVEVNTDLNEICSRTEVSLGDIALALAAGSVAVFSLTSQKYSALIGVMVAVALLPPLVVFGLLLGTGEWEDAFGAMLLLLTNIIGINLAGVLTFMLQGIYPDKWWEADQAKKATKVAICLWSFLLIVLAVIIILAKPS